MLVTQGHPPIDGTIHRRSAPIRPPDCSCVWLRQHRAGGVIHSNLTDFRIFPDDDGFASRRWPATQSWGGSEDVSCVFGDEPRDKGCEALESTARFPARSNTSTQARRTSTPTVRLVGWLEILVARIPFRLSHCSDRICGPNFPSECHSH